MQKQNTGLFIKFEKKAMLLRFVRSVLRHDFNYIIECGPKNANNSCELILQTISSKINSDFSGAKDLLLRYINVLECYITAPSDTSEIPRAEKSSNINQTVTSKSLEADFEKMPSLEVIDLRDDSNDFDIIVLDDSNVDRIQLKDTSEVLSDSGACFVDKALSSFESSGPQKKNKKQNKSKLKKKKLKHKQENEEPHSGRKRKLKDRSQIENSNSIDITDNSDCSDDDLVIIEPEPIDDSVIILDSPTQSICPSKKQKLKKKNRKIKNSPLKKLNSCKNKNKLLKAWSRPAHMSPALIRIPEMHGASSTCSVGTNIYNPNVNELRKEGLRPIVIDGSNVAIGHGKGVFSMRGLQICIDYFLGRGHRHIKIFVPHFRMNQSNFNEFNELEKRGFLIRTPSRKVDGKFIVPYDDRFIIQYAAETSGVVVSSDNYRDLYNENLAWRETIERRLLMFTWVDDVLMFPQDPLGRGGPTLDEFLRY